MSIDQSRWKDKKILVIGAGISGFAAAKIAKRLGANVILSDAKSESDLSAHEKDINELKNLGVEFRFGKQTPELLAGIDRIIVSPAVPIIIPFLHTAIERGIEIISEVELGFEVSHSPIFAVTGTNGKTTTTTLLGLLLKKKFAEVGVCGNIGVAFSETAIDLGENSAIAIEISSYQMEATKNFHPHVSTILNVTPDHIKRHGSMEVYQAMKEKIFAQETRRDYLVLNYDDSRTREIASRVDNCNVIFFSRKANLENGAFIEFVPPKDAPLPFKNILPKARWLAINWNGKTRRICTIAELGIRGNHNVENALAAAMMAYLAGVEIEEIREVLLEFHGVEHRIEFVRDIDGVRYFNDSKATNTDSAIKGIEAFDGHLILIAGGDDKGTDLTEFFDHVNKKVDELILVGAAAERFKASAIENKYPIEQIHEAGFDMEKAVNIAKNLSRAGQTVLLSPACASFDMYNNFEERGQDFKRIVDNL